MEQINLIEKRCNADDDESKDEDEKKERKKATEFSS